MDQLLLHGVTTVTCVPGESYLPILDALYDHRGRVQVVTFRHEGAAAYAASAYSRLVNQPGVCLVTRGPGATNASIAVHAAAQDGAPLVLIVGQVPRAHRHRGAAQELDVAAVFGSMCKWAVEVNDCRRIPELTARALQMATSGASGPVVLALPEDVLYEQCHVDDAAPLLPIRVQAADAAASEVRAHLRSARRPLVVAGGSGWRTTSVKDLRTWSETAELPVATAFRCQDLIDNRSPSYVGTLGLAAEAPVVTTLREADLVLLLGAQPDSISLAGYRLLADLHPGGRSSSDGDRAGGPTVVHVHPDIEELRRVLPAEIAIHADVGTFARALLRAGPLDASRWRDWTGTARRAHAQWHGDDGPLATAMRALRERLPDDAIVTNGAGVYSMRCHRHFEFRDYPTQLGPRVGSMGYGLPAAIGAKLAYPERHVVALAGDGCFLMTAQELATAAQHDLRLLVVVVNNGMYGTIRLHQEARFPGRPIATDLVNPDFAAYARAFGAHGERVAREQDLPAALDRALAHPGPALVEIVLDESLAASSGDAEPLVQSS